MKAIETRYNGHRFRSRTEARWAVFFDHLGVDYQYEPEGYELEDGERYLPDFYLPREDCYIEVKGTWPTKGETQKAGLLAYASGKWVNLIVGQPGQHDLIAFKGKPPLPGALEKWLDACPDERERWQTAGKLSNSYAVPNRFLEVPWISSIVPRYDTRYSVYGIRTTPKTLHLELDYAADLNRLMCWRVQFTNLAGREVVDERFGVHAVTEEPHRMIRGVPWNMVDGEWQHVQREYLYPAEFTTSDEFDAAIRAARSARFEFGEAGAG